MTFLQICESANVQVCYFATLEMWELSSLRICDLATLRETASLRSWKFANTRICKLTILYICEFVSLQIYEFVNLRICESANAWVSKFVRSRNITLNPFCILGSTFAVWAYTSSTPAAPTSQCCGVSRWRRKQKRHTSNIGMGVARGRSIREAATVLSADCGARRLPLL